MSKLPEFKNLSEWYNKVVPEAELACHGPVRGSMVVMPYGCAIWENIKTVLDKKIKDTGTKNAIFPLFIPESFLKKEADHVEGFSPELAVVTFAGGKKLEEPLVVRPTSETIIYYMFSQWIKSWRDLPLKINQWANVVRWEMRPRLFLRTTEFFWQEGHTAFATPEEADQDAERMIREYQSVLEEYLAIPVFVGPKSDSEKFAGADYTLTCESIMPDGKALQMCTSHKLKQQFSNAFDINYQDKEGKLAQPYCTSWGFTTRSIGAMIMAHGDDKGLVIPPKVAPYQIVIIPIYKSDNKDYIFSECEKIKEKLKDFRVHIDTRDDRPGSKFFEWELKGVPLRLELGARDLEKNLCTIANRLTGAKEQVELNNLEIFIFNSLEDMQAKLYKNAKVRGYEYIKDGKNITEFGPDIFTNNSVIKASWCSNKECESSLKQYQASIRCLLDESIEGECFACGNKNTIRVLIAKSY